jgi:hypothetical protein
MTIAFDELIRYWQHELSDDRSAEVEEALFEDAEVARKLDAIARLDAGVRRLVAEGKLQSGLSVAAVEAFERAGMSIRTYRVGRGETVPCTVALEDFVVIRLAGEFAGADRVDVVMEGTFDEMPPASERYHDIPIDRLAGEIVLVYPGDRIRALPRSRFQYTVTAGDRQLGEFRLDHTPPSALS